MTIIMQPETMDIHNLESYQIGIINPLLERNNLHTPVKLVAKTTSLRITGTKENMFNFLYEMTNVFDIKLL